MAENPKHAIHEITRNLAKQGAKYHLPYEVSLVRSLPHYFGAFGL